MSGQLKAAGSASRTPQVEGGTVHLSDAIGRRPTGLPDGMASHLS
jgi:hypothetical protein